MARASKPQELIVAFRAKDATATGRLDLLTFTQVIQTHCRHRVPGPGTSPGRSCVSLHSRRLQKLQYVTSIEDRELSIVL